MKTNAIVRIILFSVAILVLLGILIAGLGIGLFAADLRAYEGSVTTDERYVTPVDSGDNVFTQEGVLEFQASEIRDLHIEWAAGSITIEPGDTDVIKVREYGSGNPFVCRQSGDKLVIKFDDIEVYFGITIEHSKDLVITVPRDWVCGTLEMDVASANVDVSNLTIQNVEFDGASGVCTFANCNVSEMDMDTASGDIRFSGSLNYLECDAASADCVLVLSNVPRVIDMDGASGDMDITLPEGSGFTVSMDGLSTDFTSEFDFVSRNGCYVCGDGSCRIEIDAMSGDLTIRKGAATGQGHHFHDETCDTPDSTCPDKHHS